mmetsp:Transcript_19172/g.72422  ORF Transcript_19172/g.72422 Transcript_19172/m.72422 type:complete len:769 (-) Transcript_19172:265-2571(-)
MNGTVQVIQESLRTALGRVWRSLASTFETRVWEEAYNNTFPNPRALFGRLDLDNDGTISFEELMAPGDASARYEAMMQKIGSFLWPTPDWRWAVFMWRGCGGLILLALLLTMLPRVNNSIPRQLFRWPILLAVYFVIAGELAVYAILRIFIRVVEAVVATPKHRRLRNQMENAKSYEEWLALARELDHSQGRDVWQKRVNNKQHNWNFVEELLRDLRKGRNTGNAQELFQTLQICTRANVGGVMGEEQFSYTNGGEPKLIVTEFIEELARSLETLNSIVCPRTPVRTVSTIECCRALLRQVSGEEDKVSPTHANSRSPRRSVAYLKDPPTISTKGDPVADLKYAHKLVNRAKKAFGSTALCLSGGAAMGNYHFGIVKALFENECLPDIMSGTSAGSVVASFVCTRKDDEIARDLQKDVLLQHLTCFQTPWTQCIRNLLREGSLFTQKDWLDNIRWWTSGDMTFEEAYQKTGRVLNITLSVAKRSGPPILVNHITAPNVVIGSAVLASAAVPGFIQPMRLRIKGPDGVIRVHQNAELYFDGSITSDIPIAGLAETFNCRFFVVAQCNPHVVPFFFSSKGDVGQPSRWSRSQQDESWRGGFLLSVLEAYLKVDMLAKLHFLQIIEAAPGFTGTVMTQDFDGSVTIVPRVSFFDFFKLVSDPSPRDVDRYLQRGQVAAWRKVAFLKHHYRLGRQIEDCLYELEDAVASETGNTPRRRASLRATPSSSRRKWLRSLPIHDDSEDFATASPAKESFGAMSLGSIVPEAENAHR